ncbi:MAG: hypothetical protein GXY85_00345 [Candidatus Brocadiaceae bacterium]|nr:hypothetical protein [Candidatus Brocadiaceae bacterium]
MTNEQSVTRSAGPGRPGAAPPTAVPTIRRPGEEIANRPQLRVKTRAEDGEASDQPAPLRRVAPITTVAPPADAQKQPDAEERTRTVVLAPPPAPNGRNPFATHGPPPTDEEAARAELAVFGSGLPERRFSTGFVLGVALVVVVLVGGIWLSRLGNRVAMLENRLNRVEGIPVQTAALDQPGR